MATVTKSRSRAKPKSRKAVRPTPATLKDVMERLDKLAEQVGVVTRDRASQVRWLRDELRHQIKQIEGPGPLEFLRSVAQSIIDGEDIDCKYVVVAED
ncbi:MAG: hypothetical protein GY778_13700 [bacterium]|nr:hypothetical protein [bacterium]